MIKRKAVIESIVSNDVSAPRVTINTVGLLRAVIIKRAVLDKDKFFTSEICGFSP